MPSILDFLRGGAARPNAALEPPRITLARRLVETPGAPFVESRERFGDVASARDELGLLPASQGATVVRVHVTGDAVGTDEEWEILEGDWLCDPDVGERIVRLPEPRWGYDDEARKWARDRAWLEAWETCQNGYWMLQAASLAGVDRKLIALAACACARTALPHIPTEEERPLRAIEATERWTRGEATPEEVRAAADAAAVAYRDYTETLADAGLWIDADAADPATTAAAAAQAAADDAEADADDAEAWPDAAADAWIDVVDAAAAAYAAAAYAAAWLTAAVTLVDVPFVGVVTQAIIATRVMSRAHSADLVRSVIPTLTVLRAVATRT